MLHICFRGVGNTEFIPHHKKFIWGAIAGAAGSLLGAGIGGSLSNRAAQTMANAQLQATRETNQNNLLLAQRQNDWNVEQWNRQNEYNTPLAQRQRYEAAGINPYFAMGNIQSGTADSLLSADMANQVSPQIDSQAYHDHIGENLAATIPGAISSVFDSQIKQQQIKSMQLQNTLDMTTLVDKANSLKYDNEAKKMANDLYNSSLESLKNIQKNQERMSYTQEYMSRLQAVGTSYANVQQDFINRNILPQNAQIAKMTLNQMVAQIAKTAAEEQYTRKQTALAAKYAAAAWMNANANMFNARTGRLQFLNESWNRNQSTYRENYVFNRTKNDVVNQIKLGVDMLRSDQKFKKFGEDWWLNSRPSKFIYGSGMTLKHINPFQFFK